MKVGDYVRTNKGTFDRFITSHTLDNLTWYTFEDRGNITNPENYIIKSSPNIIDLIEVGDYVNGSKVIDIAQAPKKAIYLDTSGVNLIPVVNSEIQTIITKEQFECMEYKVKE